MKSKEKVKVEKMREHAVKKKRESNHTPSTTLRDSALDTGRELKLKKLTRSRVRHNITRLRGNIIELN